ncbi:hypothetical protein Gpo141_00000019 [Globisporangium polare]
MPHSAALSADAVDASIATSNGNNNHATAAATTQPDAHGTQATAATLDIESALPAASDATSTAAHTANGANAATSTPGKRALANSPFLKYGYLFKQSSGKWKRKRWNQRWFVLDSETGLLKYFRHASLPEAVGFRQDAHGALQLQEKGVSLVIQGDLPRGVPTPFCFTVSGAGSREIHICADTNQEFKEWTNAISLVMSPREVTESEDQDEHGVSGGGMVDATKDDSTRPSVRINNNGGGGARDSSASSSSSGPPSPTRGDDESMSETDELASSPHMRRGSSTKTHAMPVHKMFGIFPSNMRSKLSGHEKTALLLVLNPVVVLIRFGSLQAVYASAFFINAVCVWLLWLHNAPDDAIPVPGARTSATAHRRKSTRFEPKLDFDGLLSDVPVKLSQSASSKLSNSNLQQPFVSKFAGTVNGVKVSAGASIKMCAPEPAEIVAGCWTQICATRFNVRQGPNYRRTKIKAASTPALLELVAIDVYRSEGKVDNIASIIDISNLKNAEHDLDLFIVNCQVPNYQPSNPLWGEKQGDGTGFNFVTYFAIPPAIRKMLNDSSIEPPLQAVRLLKNFMAGVSGVRDRFKAIGIVVNPQEQKLGRTERHLLETYNGQPILTRPQHRFYEGDGYFEVDVDAHEFNFVARKGLVGVSEHFRNMVVDFGFVLEGQEDAELPEQILGCVRLCKIDVRQAALIA